MQRKKAKSSKNQLRKTYLQKRDRLTSVARARDSAIIRQRLFRHPEWQDVHTILTYVSFRSEVETHKLIQEALEQNKRIVVPCVDVGDKVIRLSELHDIGSLAPGAYGIYEPARVLREPVDPSEIELIVIPGVVFDRQGGRIGMGGGYFDKLLMRMPRARRIAVAFSNQVRRQPLPLHAHDIPMHLIITEKEVIDLGRP